MNRTCASCEFFGIDENPKHFLVNGKWVYGWRHRCDFDREKKNGSREACERYVNADEKSAREKRERFGYDKPAEATAGAVQRELL